MSNMFEVKKPEQAARLSFNGEGVFRFLSTNTADHSSSAIRLELKEAKELALAILTSCMEHEKRNNVKLD